MKRNPHPARGSRVTALGVSVTAFVSIVTSLAWNTHQTELAANAAPVQQLIPLPGTTTTTSTPVMATATINPVAPAAPAKTSGVAKSTTAVASATPVVPATPVAPASQTNVAVAPAAPAATVMYTCMSPGGKTENPSASGACKNAKYGYVLTQI